MKSDMKLDFFTTAAPGVFGASVATLFRREDGRAFGATLRVDARDPHNVRVDRHDLAVWAAIDGGKGFKTLEAAKRYAERWAGAARKHKTFYPKVGR